MRNFLESFWRHFLHVCVQWVVEIYLISLLGNSRHSFGLKLFLLILNEVSYLSHIPAVIWNISLIIVTALTTNITVSRIYNLGNVTIWNFLNFCPQDFLCFYRNITLIVLFCFISALCKFVDEFQKIISNSNNDWKCAK